MDPAVEAGLKKTIDDLFEGGKQLLAFAIFEAVKGYIVEHPENMGKEFSMTDDFIPWFQKKIIASQEKDEPFVLDKTIIEGMVTDGVLTFEDTPWTFQNTPAYMYH